ncbi:MAG TPA: gamma-glutamyltransferase, partial [Rubrivivax sp.]|nr:gamma-glutamyltransferase [Rubrivivax sp.]
GQNPQAACDAPRWRFNLQQRVNLEDGVRADTAQCLQELGHRLDRINDSYQDFGAGQFIWRLDEGQGDAAVLGYAAASDPRRDGLAAGF